jgi:hypothetical protein
VSRITENNHNNQDNVVHIDTERKKLDKQERKPPGKILIAFYVVLTGFIIAATIYYTIHRDTMNADSVNRLLESVRISFASAETADTFAYDEGRGSVFAPYKGGLAVMSKDRLAVYCGAGNERIALRADERDPVLRAGSDHLLSFGRGGERLRLIRNYRVENEMTFDGGIIAADITANGQFAVLYRQRGYAAVAGVYKRNGDPLYRWNSAEQYLLDCALAPNGSRLALATVRQDGQKLTGGIRVMNVRDDSGIPVGEYSRDDEIPIAVMYKNNSTIYTLWENSMIILDADCNAVGSYSWQGRILRGFCFNGNLPVLQLSRNDAGGGSEMVVLDNEGQVISRRPFHEDIVSIGAAGAYISLLTHERVNVYEYGGEWKLFGTSAVNAGTARVLQRDNGSVMLIGPSGASLLSYFEVMEIE